MNKIIEVKNKNILFYGLSTYDNLGCEAIVETLSNQIKEYNKNSKITCAIFDYKNNLNKKRIDKYIKHYRKTEDLTEEETRQLEYYKTQPFDYNNFERIYESEIIKEIKYVDLCFSIGGDNYCYGASNWLYTINNEIQKKHKKSVLFGASIFEEINDSELLNDLNKYDLLVIRESMTYNAIEKYVEKDRILLLPDPAFSLEPKKVDINYDLENFIGLNISPIILENNEEILIEIEKFVNYIINNTSYNIVLIPHVYNKESNDLDALDKIKIKFSDSKRIVILNERKYNCKEIKYIISKLKFLIASRTHASIAAYSSSVPTLVIGYSVKSKGIAKDLFGDYENYVISKENLTSEKLISKFKYIEENERIIRRKLDDIMPDIKRKSSNLYKEIINALNHLEEKNVIHPKLCVGCSACFNICPYQAIEMIENKEGFKEPLINKEKCIKCGLCKKTCPINKKLSTNKCQEAYAAFNKSEKEQITSSSGGIFIELSKAIIKDKGIVYGASITQNKVYHLRIDNINELNKLKGSKYVQSDIKDILPLIEKDLKANKAVLFSGTPCQISGLKSYLNQEYDKLILLSVICHGVPSPKTFESYINYLGSNITDFQFRDKSISWEKPNIKFRKNEEEIRISHEEDIYMNAFSLNLDLRYSCYNCNFKVNGKNDADIILGDYWGIFNEHQDFFNDKGVSAVILQTQKGQDLFKKIKENVNFIETKYENILKSNESLEKSPSISMERFKLFNECSLENSQDLVKNIKCFKNEIMLKKLKEELKDKEDFIISLKKENDNLKEDNNNLKTTLSNIENSKRWKYINKLCDKIKKVN